MSSRPRYAWRVLLPPRTGTKQTPIEGRFFCSTSAPAPAPPAVVGSRLGRTCGTPRTPAALSAPVASSCPWLGPCISEPPTAACQSRTPPTPRASPFQPKLWFPPGLLSPCARRIQASRATPWLPFPTVTTRQRVRGPARTRRQSLGSCSCQKLARKPPRAAAARRRFHFHFVRVQKVFALRWMMGFGVGSQGGHPPLAVTRAASVRSLCRQQQHGPRARSLKPASPGSPPRTRRPVVSPASNPVARTTPRWRCPWLGSVSVTRAFSSRTPAGREASYRRGQLRGLTGASRVSRGRPCPLLGVVKMRRSSGLPMICAHRSGSRRVPSLGS